MTSFIYTNNKFCQVNSFALVRSSEWLLSVLLELDEHNAFSHCVLNHQYFIQHILFALIDVSGVEIATIYHIALLMHSMKLLLSLNPFIEYQDNVTCYTLVPMYNIFLTYDLPYFLFRFLYQRTAAEAEDKYIYMRL